MDKKVFLVAVLSVAATVGVLVWYGLIDEFALTQYDRTFTVISKQQKETTFMVSTGGGAAPARGVNDFILRLKADERQEEELKVDSSTFNSCEPGQQIRLIYRTGRLTKMSYVDSFTILHVP